MASRLLSFEKFSLAQMFLFSFLLNIDYWVVDVKKQRPELKKAHQSLKLSLAIPVVHSKKLQAKRTSNLLLISKSKRNAHLTMEDLVSSQLVKWFF